MNLDPHMQALADLLVEICVRELKQEAHRGKEYARTDRHRILAKGSNNDDIARNEMSQSQGA